MLDAEGDLAIALETYSSRRLRQWSDAKLQGIDCSGLAIDMFITEGQVNGQSVLDIFAANQPRLSETDQALVKGWKDTFNGLFVVLQVTPQGYELMNWLTEKQYWVQSSGLQSEERLARLSPGEIVAVRLSPVPEADWIFSGPLLLLGKLGKPKLAVAIGNFKNWFPNYLYGDAPDLLEEAWKSVKHYHDEFVQFFEAERVTLSGYELNKKLNAYQEFATQRQLERTGIDSSKSLKDLMDQAGVSQEEVSESVESLGAEGRQVKRLLESSKSVKMVMPPLKLPDDLRKAEAVTVFVHPRWGQMMLKDYGQMTQLLEAADEASLAKLDLFVHRYLKNEAATAYVWQSLAEENPEALEAALSRVLDRPVSLQDDLEKILLEFGKSLEPKLPEVASVPVHLHNLFQEALQEVNGSSSKKKAKGKRKQKAGFAAL